MLPKNVLILGTIRNRGIHVARNGDVPNVDKRKPSANARGDELGDREKTGG
jgi:hypothetical protein